MNYYEKHIFLTNGRAEKYKTTSCPMARSEPCICGRLPHKNLSGRKERRIKCVHFQSLTTQCSNNHARVRTGLARAPGENKEITFPLMATQNRPICHPLLSSSDNAAEEYKCFSLYFYSI